MLNSEQLLNTIQEKHNQFSIPPIVIPSYNRPKSKLIKRCVEENIEAFVFVEKSQIEDYAKIIGDSNSVRLIESIEPIVPKRNYINEKMYELGYSNIIVMDDDITQVSRLEPSTTKAGKYKSKCVPISLADMQLIFGYMCNKYSDFGLIGISHDASAFTINLNTCDEIVSYQMIMQVVCINLDIVHKFNLQYESNIWDDFDFMLQMISTGTKVYKIPWVSEGSPSIIKMQSVCYGNELTDKFNKYLIISRNLANKWGQRYIRLQTVRGFPNCRFNWQAIQADINRYGKLIDTNIHFDKIDSVRICDIKYPKIISNTLICSSDVGLVCVDNIVKVAPFVLNHDCADAEVTIDSSEFHCFVERSIMNNQYKLKLDNNIKVVCSHKQLDLFSEVL